MRNATITFLFFDNKNKEYTIFNTKDIIKSYMHRTGAFQRWARSRIWSLKFGG